jgi:hypothetical protein
MDAVHEETYMLLGLFALGGWVLYLFFRRQQMHLQARMKRTEVFDHLIEKFSTSQEFIEFLKTDQGKKLVEDPIGQPAHHSQTVLRFILVGVVFAAISIACLVYANNLAGYIKSIPDPDINYINKQMDYRYWGTLTMALSAGMFLMATVTKTLAKRWKLNGSNNH